jgi:hypothetical protein
LFEAVKFLGVFRDRLEFLGVDMTQDDAVNMAKQCGASADGKLWLMYSEDIEAFAKLVAEREREACAKICDELDSNSYPYVVVFPNKCAEAIRARQ